jgi:hypothetical protein
VPLGEESAGGEGLRSLCGAVGSHAAAMVVGRLHGEINAAHTRGLSAASGTIAEQAMLCKLADVPIQGGVPSAACAIACGETIWPRPLLTLWHSESKFFAWRGSPFSSFIGPGGPDGPQIEVAWLRNRQVIGIFG